MRFSLSKRMVGLSLLLSILLLGSWVFWCFHDTRHTLVDQKKQDIQVLVDRTVDYTRLYSQGLNASLLGLCSTMEVMEQDPVQIQGALNGFQNSNPGKVLSVAYITAAEAYCNRSTALEIFGNVHFQEFYEIATQSNYQGLRWSEPYISPLTLARTVALYKPVRLFGDLGAVVIEINLGTMLSSILQATNDSSLTWAVVSGKGQLVATSDDYTTISSNYKQISRSLLESELPALNALPVGAAFCQVGGVDYLHFRSSATCMDWTLIALAQEQLLYSTIAPLLLRTLGMGALHLILLTIALALLGRRYTHPIVGMASKIEKAESPLTLSFPETMARDDEIGVLTRSISDMILRINRLNQERETILSQQRLLEIDVLQGQIHPHFLGNTLACIQSLVKDGQRENTLLALTALVRLLNYSIARTDATVCLKDELNCTNAYVELRKMRVSYSFEYEVYVSPAHLAHPVPRLILQPIIENSIVHGFAGLNHQGMIVITSYVRAGKLFLCVDDNGLGAPNHRLAAVASGIVSPSAHSHGIGVNNVFKRLRLNDATPNGCQLLAKSDGGVRAILDLGVFSGEQENKAL